MEAVVRSHKDNAAKNVQGFKSRLGIVNAEKSKLAADLAELQNQMKILTAERDALKNATSNEPSKNFTQELDALRREKAVLEKALADEKATKILAPSEQSTEQASIIVCVDPFALIMALLTDTRSGCSS